MELTSLKYIFFVGVFLIAYYALRPVKRGQQYLIAAANVALICLMTRKTVFLLIFLLALFAYLMGLFLEKAAEGGKKSTKTVLLWVSLSGVLAFLCYFKFFKWTYESLQVIAAQRGIGLADLIVPIGVSYYSLTLCAYFLDIYHKKHAAEHHFLDFFNLVTFFPAIIEGPIGFYRKLMPQLKQEHSFKPENMTEGFTRILWGYFKKVVIADRIGVFVIAVLSDGEAGGWLLFFAMILYSFQIYTDFSGGIDVVIGVAKMMDITLSENFKAPLMSRSVTEYWGRWHMSLGEFMEKYLYYPIVLNRKVMKLSKKIRSSYLSKAFSATLASVIVFIVVGIWHGTGWNYVVYGCYQALFVGSAVLLGPVYKSCKSKLRLSDENAFWRVFVILRTFVILTFGRYFIRAKDLPQAWELFSRTFGASSGTITGSRLLEYGLDLPNMIVMFAGILIVIAADIVAGRGIKIREKVIQFSVAARLTIYVLTIFCILIFGMYGQEFKGASFIYQGL